jgi:hypothetical protein
MENKTFSFFGFLEIIARMIVITKLNPALFVESYLVSRIDGPGGLTQKYNMIANAIYADKYVNTGTFF